MNLVFCGTPAFAVPTLEKLVKAGFEVRLAVTQPDRLRGRGMESAFSPVKQKALELQLSITQPDGIKNNVEFRDQLAAAKPDAIIVVGYGRIIPQWMIDLPSLGNINLHASLLPKYRGAAPIQWAIAGGEVMTGVTTMRINTGLDTGDILLQKEISIAPGDTALTLGPKLAAIGSEVIIETLRGLQAGTLHPRPQDDKEATLAPILRKEDGRIDFHRAAADICNRIRGFQPWPGAFTAFRKKNLHIWQAKPIHREISECELLVEDGDLFVGCGGNTSLLITELQPEGRKRMTAHDFVHGYRPRNGELLGK
ncbi:MAG: methionyl-tRNA formyltransferase [Terriglobales bacterium]